MALDDGGCLTELLQVVERAKIPRTPDERAIKSISRLPCRIFERWILCWLRVGSNPTIVKSFLERVLHHVKLNCTSVQSHLINRGRSQTVPHEGGSITVSADRRLSFWIANLFEFLGFLQWAVSDVNDSDSDGRDQGEGQNGALSERILTLLQLRTDVARVVEELYRAWLTDLFRQLSKLGVAALLDHQGLTGFTSDPQQHPQEPQSSLKLLMIPFAKLTTGGGLGERLPGIDDLVESLDELADSMEASHLHPEIAIQLFSSVISHFCAAAFNQLLLRKNYATWKRGIQIQYNLSRLEEWANTLQAKNPGYFFSSSTAASPTGLIPSSMAATTTSPLWQIEPLIQAVKLLQLAKTKVATDLDLLLEAAPRLNLAQIRKILSVYVPDAYEDGPVSPEVLRGMTARIQQVQYELKGQLVETLPEPQPLSLPLQLSMRPVTPVPFSSLPTAAVPPHLWKIFALIDSTC